MVILFKVQQQRRWHDTPAAVHARRCNAAPSDGFAIDSHRLSHWTTETSGFIVNTEQATVDGV